jgi:hypothetical protein
MDLEHMTGFKITAIFAATTAGVGALAQTDLGFLTEMSRSAPYALAFIVLVYLFIQHLNLREKRYSETLTAIVRDFSSRAKETHETQRDAVLAIRENSKVNGETSAVLREATQMIAELRASVKGSN